jgi:hypothetical protein
MQKLRCYTGCMAFTIWSMQHLSDSELFAQVQRAAERERNATVQLIALLAELDSRRLYLGVGCSSLFAYCTQVLHLSEHAAYGRIEAARAARRFPILLERLSEGTLTLTAIGLLAPHLTQENVFEVIDAALGKSKRDIELLVARLNPRPDAPAAIRKLPEPMPPLPAAADEPTVELPAAVQGQRILTASNRGSRPAAPEPLSPGRYKIQFTVSTETYNKLRLAQDLLRHSIRNGDAAAILDQALTLLLADLSKKKLAATLRPRIAKAAASGSRHIPSAVKRAVWARDGGGCAFVGTAGRCRETGFLEFHHVVPFGAGGATTVENVALRCRAHNQYEAEQYYGQSFPWSEKSV